MFESFKKWFYCTFHMKALPNKRWVPFYYFWPRICYQSVVQINTSEYRIYLISKILHHTSRNNKRCLSLREIRPLSTNKNSLTSLMAERISSKPFKTCSRSALPILTRSTIRHSCTTPELTWWVWLPKKHSASISIILLMAPMRLISSLSSPTLHPCLSMVLCS